MKKKLIIRALVFVFLVVGFTVMEKIYNTVPIEQVPPPPPVKIIKVQQIPIDNNHTDCLYTYSDKTTERRHWKVIEPHGIWLPDENGNSGHWAETFTLYGDCTNRSIGKLKSAN